MGGRDATMVLLDENGIRCDGRKIDEPRRIMIRAGGLKNADGSAYIEFGDNKILSWCFWSKGCSSKTYVQHRYRNFTSKISYGAISLLVREKILLLPEEKLKFPK